MADFEIRPLSDKRKESIKSRTEWSADSPLSLDRIVVVHFLHETFQHDVRKGQIHILEDCADQVLEIFRKLFVIEFPVHSAIPIDEFDGDDVKSMEVNNSSGFNPRKVMNTDRWSSHAYGCAIDINPLQNPYVLRPGSDDQEIHPLGGADFLDREKVHSGMVESVVSIFKSHGFEDWGGAWKAPLDYHHFQVDWDVINDLV